MPLLCTVCGLEVEHECVPEKVIKEVSTTCRKQGVIWVRVKAEGDPAKNVPVTVEQAGKALQNQNTDLEGFTGFQPVPEGEYKVRLASVPDDLLEKFGLPENNLVSAVVALGRITYLKLKLQRRRKPEIDLPVAVAAVGGARIKLTLKAVPPMEGKGKGTLTITQGKDSVRLFQASAPVVLTGNSVEFDSIPSAGIELDVEAAQYSAVNGVEFDWKLSSDQMPVSSASKQQLMTTVQATLKVETKTAALTPDVQHTVGGVVHVQDTDGNRARLKVTVTCLPADYPGLVELSVLKDNIELFDSPDKGALCDLSAPIKFAANVPPYYLEGKRVSDDVKDTGLKLAITGLLDGADIAYITVVEIKLQVYNGRPGNSDPATLMTDVLKKEPGRRVYVQNTDTWWWNRAEICILKNPPLAPCKLHFRSSGDGAVKLFPKTAPNGHGVQTQLEMHLDGEVVVHQPFDIAQDELPDKDVGRTMWVEGETATTGAQRFRFHVDLKEIDDDCDSVSFRVLTPLAEYQRINIVDLGGPGSGHQGAVIKLLLSIAAIGFAGDVVLTYNVKKTKIYAETFGKQADLASPVESYNLYHAEWTVQFPASGAGIHKLAVRCIPIGELAFQFSATLQRVYTTLPNLWQNFAWLGATPAAYNDLKPAGALSAPPVVDWGTKRKYSDTNQHLLRDQTAFRKTFYNQETAPGLADEAPLRAALAPPVTRTLSAFGAMDVHHHDLATEYELFWLPIFRTMTGEADPVSMIFQPFLWTGGHAMEVREAATIYGNIRQKVEAAGGKPAYGWRPADAGGDDGVIASQPAVARKILEMAKNNTVVLITCYYGETVSAINYEELLKMLAEVAERANLPKKVVVALLGNDRSDAHTAISNELAKPGVVIARTDAADSGPTVKVELAHIGRTGAMTQFQRYSSIVVTEGANTWQELLTMGVPGLSAMPGADGNTRPWLEPLPAGPGAAIVGAASDALITAKNSGDPGYAAAIQTLVNYLNAVLDPGSDVRTYFNDWKTAMTNPISDQVVAGVMYLPDPDM